MSAQKRGDSMIAMTRAFGNLATGVGAVWYAILMRPVTDAAAFGPICHHGGSLALHCPACYAALALGALGLGLTIVARPAREGARARA